jgi:prevent-host-death family protein
MEEPDPGRSIATILAKLANYSYLPGMKMVNVHQAKTELSRLLEAVEGGEEVIIARSGVPVARLVRVRPDERVPGRLAGVLELREDFDAPLPSEVSEGFGLEPK